MAWNTSAVTDAGAELLSASLAGTELVISSVAGGVGLTDEADLKSMTQLRDRRQTLSLVRLERVSGAVQIRFQIKNNTVETGYQLQQIGIYGKLAGDTAETLLLVVQDEAGIAIPAASAVDDFLAEMYVVLAISNTANISITVDPASVVSAADFAVLEAEVEALHDTATTTSDGLMSAADKAALDDVSSTYLPTENVVNNQTTTAEGYALDARQGKILGDEIDTLNSNFDTVTEKTYLYNETTNANTSVITISSNQSYLENNTIHLAAVITMTGNRAANSAIIGFMNHPPTARTSYCLFVNGSTGAVTTGHFAPANNGYIYTSAALTSGVQYYIYGTLPLD